MDAPPTLAVDKARSQEASAIVSDALWYVIATYVAQAITLIAGLFSRRILGPEHTGVLAVVNIVAMYLSLGHLGAMEGGQKEIPFLFGRGDVPRAHKVSDTMYSLSLTTSIFTAVVGFVLVLSLKNQISHLLLAGLALVLVRLAFHQKLTADTVVLRSEKRFRLLSVTLVVVASSNLLLVLSVVRLYGILGAYASLLSVTLLNLAIWHLWRRRRLGSGLGFRWHLDSKDMYALLSIGFPLMLYSLLFSFIKSADSILVAKFAGTTALGYYSIATLLATLIWNMPNAFSVIMFPRFQERFGMTGSQASLRTYVTIPLHLFAGCLLPIAVGTAFVIAPTGIRFVLPEFVDGIPALKVLLIGTFFLSLVHMPIQLLITTNRWRSLLLIQLAVITFLVSANYAALAVGWGIVGAAAATACAYFVFFSMLFFFAFRYLGTSSELIRLYGQILSFFIYLTLLSVTSSLLPRALGLNTGSELVALGLSLSCLLAGLLPLLYYVNRRVGLAERIRWEVANLLGMVSAEAS